MSFYLDASVIVAILLHEDSSGATIPWVEALDRPGISDLARGEVISALHRSVRNHRHSLDEIEHRLRAFEGWRARCQTIDHPPVDMSAAVTFVQRLDLSLRMPDAIHLAACARLGLTLATFDRRLLRAAEALGIPALAPA